MSTNVALACCIWLAAVQLCLRPTEEVVVLQHHSQVPSSNIPGKSPDDGELTLITMTSEDPFQFGILDFAEIWHSKKDKAKTYRMSQKLASRTWSAYLSKKFKRTLFVERLILMTFPYEKQSKRIIRFRPPVFQMDSYLLKWKFPLAYTILLNFGFDGKSHIMFSNTHWDSIKGFDFDCKGNEIYDPINNKCRRVTCESGYTFVDGSCKKSSGIIGPSTVKFVDIPDQPNEDIIMIVLKANVTFSDYMVSMTEEFKLLMVGAISNLLNITDDRIKNFTVQLAETRSKSAKISIQRIPVNQVKLYFAELDKPNELQADSIQHNKTKNSETEIFTMEISFILMPLNKTKNGKSVSTILENMDALVQSNGFMIKVNETQLTVVGLKNEREPTMLDSWCEHGIKRYYMDDQFAMVQVKKGGSKVEMIYTNKTKRLYGKGEFDLTIVVHSTIGFEKANVSGFVFVCDYPRLRNKKCGRISLNENEYEILANKSVIFGRYTLGIDDYHIKKNGTIVICIPTTMKLRRSIIKGCDEGSDNKNLHFAQIILTMIFGVLSLVALLAVLITYSLFSKLRNIPGINTMNLTLALFLAELIFLVFGSVESDVICTTVAISLHYLFLASFFWMNVMSYDLFRTFGHTNVLPVPRSKSKVIPRYILYAWGTPFLIVAACIATDFSGLFPTLAVSYGKSATHLNIRNPVVVPRGNNRSSLWKNATIPPFDTTHTSQHLGCWIQDPRASLIAFGVPLICILLVNAILFARTIYCIRLNLRTINLRLSHPVSGRNDVILYVRMSVVMGFTWVLGLASSLISSGANPTKPICLLLNIMGILFVIFNCSQGLFICFVFVMNRRVCGLYKMIWAKFTKSIKHQRTTIAHVCSD